MMYYTMRSGKATYAGSCIAAWRYWLEREREHGLRSIQVADILAVLRYCGQKQAKLGKK